MGLEKGRKAGRSRAWIEHQLRAKGIDEETVCDITAANTLKVFPALRLSTPQ